MSIRLYDRDEASTIDQKSTTQHGTYHLSDNVNLWEPQRSNNFEFIVTGLDDLAVLGSSAQAIANAQEYLRLAVKSTSVPHFKQDVIEIKRGNSTLKYAGTPSFDSGNLQIYDFIGANSKEILQAWQHKSYNVHTEKVGLGSDYKKDCYLIEYTPTYQKVRSWTLHGCWISSISEDDYDTDSSGKRTVKATIEYDRAEINLSETDVDII